MANPVQVQNSQQQQIVRMLQSMDGKFNLWEVWQDFILMMATSIVNKFPGPLWQEREDMYLKTAKKYSKKELDYFAEMCAYVVDGLEKNPEQDFLGSLFMALELGSNWKGQFFTPYSVCQMMGQVTGVQHVKDQLESQGWVGVNDPACGAGRPGFKKAAARTITGLLDQKDSRKTDTGQSKSQNRRPGN